MPLAILGTFSENICICGVCFIRHILLSALQVSIQIHIAGINADLQLDVLDYLYGFVHTFCTSVTVKQMTINVMFVVPKQLQITPVYGCSLARYTDMYCFVTHEVLNGEIS